MLTIISFIEIRQTNVDMKRDETQMMAPEQLAQARLVGERIARLRRARDVR